MWAMTIVCLGLKIKAINKSFKGQNAVGATRVRVFPIVLELDTFREYTAITVAISCIGLVINNERQYAEKYSVTPNLRN